jgi:hypothetical protein
MQQSHSVPPQSQPKQGFVGPAIGFAMVDVVEEVDGGILGALWWRSGGLFFCRSMMYR